MNPDRVARVDYDKVQALGRELLIALGQDPEREGLVDTPRRWASWWKEFIDYDPGVTDTTFEVSRTEISTDQMVVIAGMRVYSICEHHLLPFWCDISIGYIVRDKVLGLSKFARIAHEIAHGLQLQERIVQQIGEEVQRVTESPDVAVLASGVHLCMLMRGIKTEGVMSSMMTHGAFADRADLRAEFMRLTDRKMDRGNG